MYFQKGKEDINEVIENYREQLVIKLQYLESEGTIEIEKELLRLKSDLLGIIAPYNLDFNLHTNYVYESEKSFESLVFTLATHTPRNPKELTIFEFLSLLEFVKAKIKAQSKALKKP